MLEGHDWGLVDDWGRRPPRVDDEEFFGGLLKACVLPEEEEMAALTGCSTDLSLSAADCGAGPRSRMSPSSSGR